MGRLRDNVELWDMVRHEVFSTAVHAIGDKGIRGSTAREVAERILDAVERALAVTRAADSGCELFGLTDGKYTCATSGLKSRCDTPQAPHLRPRALHEVTSDDSRR